MTSRQRVSAAIQHQHPDKLPIDFGGHRSSGISAIAYANLKKAMGITSGDIYVYDFIQQLAIVEEPVLEAFDVDVIELGRGFCLDDSDWKEWELPDGTPCKIPAFIHTTKEGDDWFILTGSGEKVGIQKKGCLYFEQYKFPLAERGIEHDDFSDLDVHLTRNMWGTAATPGGHFDLHSETGFRQFKEGAARLRESTDRAIIGLFGGSLFETPQFLYRADQYLLYLHLYPEKVIQLSEALTERYLANLERYLSAVGEYIDILLFGDDLGTNMGPMIDPAMYREYYKPFHKKMWSRAKALFPHLKIQLHCCGGIEPFLDDMIDAGLDSINPVQISALGMDPGTLRSRYEGRMCFWGGGCNTQEVLNRKSPDEVETHVMAMLDAWKPGGGYVFQQVHNILADVPPENIIRMFETVKKYRLKN